MFSEINQSVQKASVMWMFKKVGRIDVKLLRAQDQDDVLETALGNDMDDFDINNSGGEGQNTMKVCCAIQRSIFCNLNVEFLQLYCPPERLAQLAEAVSTHPSVELQERRITYIPENPINPLDEGTQDRLNKLLDRLWADEDTLNIWTTVDKK